MPKILSMIGLIVGVVLLLLFGADLVSGFPFRSASPGIDVAFVLSSIILIALSYLTYREQK